MSNTLMPNRGIWAGAPAIGFFQPTAKKRRAIRVTGLNKSEAEDLLDWLEASGYRNYHVTYAAGEGFTVSQTNGPEADG